MQPIGTGRLLIVLLLATTVHSSLREFDNNIRESILARAIVRIISNVPDRQLTTLHFIQYEAKQDDVISGAVNLIRSSHAYTIENIDQIKDWYLRWFNIILINEQKEFSNFAMKLNGTHFDPRGYYIIVVEPALNASDRENLSRNVLKSFFDLFYDNVIVLFRDEAGLTVFMYTFLPCDRTHACYEVVPVLYNTFDGVQFEKKIRHFPKKWENFNGCPISVGLSHLPPHILLTETEQGETEIDGLDVKILRMIESHLNFTIDYKITNRGRLHKNGTGTFAFNMLLNGEANLIIGGYGQNEDTAKYVSASVPYLQTDFVYALPVSLEFGSLERHLLPLKKEIWIVYFSIHCAAFLFLSILKRYGSRVYCFVVGDHTRSPFLDMFQMFFAVGLPRTPRFTFARTLFGIWLISTFIISTTYQGQLVKMLTSRSSKNTPHTIKELEEMKYEIYVRPPVLYFMAMLHGNNIRISVTERLWDSFLELQIHSGRRRAVADTDVSIKFFNALQYRDGVLPILPERVQHSTLYIYFIKNSYFVPPFNHILQHFSYSGLIDKWTGDILNISSTKNVRTSGPIKLNLSHFEGTFELYAMVTGISILMFVAELISLRWERLRRIIMFYTE